MLAHFIQLILTLVAVLNITSCTCHQSTLVSSKPAFAKHAAHVTMPAYNLNFETHTQNLHDFLDAH